MRIPVLRVRPAAVAAFIAAAAVFSACEESGQSAVTSTATAKPAPTAAPAPPEFAIGPINALTAGDGDGSVQVEIGFEVGINGGPTGPDPTGVLMTLDGGEPQVIAELGQLSPGSSIQVADTLTLAPGPHRVVVEVEGARRTHAWTVRSADVTLQTVRRSLIDAETVAVAVEIENRGSLPAGATTILADISSASGEPVPGQLAFELEDLAPGERRTATFDLEIGEGVYQANIVAKGEAPEADLANNRVEFEFGVDLVELVTEVNSIATADWDRDGNGVSEIVFSVRNDGFAASGLIEVGVICQAGVSPNCDQTREMFSIPPGNERQAKIHVPLPPGPGVLTIYAGDSERTHSWGDNNVLDVDVDVPPQPERHLLASPEWEIAGFYQDSTARVILKSSLRNAGSEAITDPVQVAIACASDGRPESACAAETSVVLRDGFGPAEFELEVTAQQGAVAELRLDGQTQAVSTFGVPRRIIGIDKVVWDCFRQRTWPTKFPCSGFRTKNVIKWPTGHTVRYWTIGRPEYVEAFEELLADVATLADLRFEKVESRSDAELIAFLAYPRDDMQVQWQNCQDGLTCNTLAVDDGTITGAQISIWDRGDIRGGFLRELVRVTMWRELVTVTTGMWQRAPFEHTLGRSVGISSLEEKMIRLNLHPLVEPGMNMASVRKLIVLSDQLLDK